jgi:hypothetical protein
MNGEFIYRETEGDTERTTDGARAKQCPECDADSLVADSESAQGDDTVP